MQKDRKILSNMYDTRCKENVAYHQLPGTTVERIMSRYVRMFQAPANPGVQAIGLTSLGGYGGPGGEECALDTVNVHRCPASAKLPDTR